MLVHATPVWPGAITNGMVYAMSTDVAVVDPRMAAALGTVVVNMTQYSSTGFDTDTCTERDVGPV